MAGTKGDRSMSMNVGNCPRCGKLYVKGIHEYCPDCVRDIENQYSKCYKYLRENRKTTLQELSEATGVSVKQITKFIREGRISIANNPNMFYECEMCGSSIREGTMCEPCRLKLLKDARSMFKDDRKKKDPLQPDSHVSFKIQDRLQERR
jgi:flagellar operon protein (TIGR03826 family)